MNQHRYLHEQIVCRELSNFAYWSLLCRTALLGLAVFASIVLILQNGLEPVQYLNMIDMTVLIVTPLFMAELIIKRDRYPNKSWNSMLLLASLIIGLSSLGIFY